MKRPRVNRTPYAIGSRSRAFRDTLRVQDDPGLSLSRDALSVIEVEKFSREQSIPCQLIRQGRKPVPA